MALNPANYGQILNQVLNLSGIDRATLPTLEWNLFRDLSSRRLKYAWQAAKWPEVTVTESRTVTQTGGDEGNYIALNQAGQTEIGEVFAVWNKSPKSNQDQVYDNTAGQFYEANQSVAAGSNSPTAQPSYWDVVAIPNIFFDYLVRGTYSDYLRHNGELDRARVAEADARDVLDHELLKLHTQQGQTTRLEVAGY